MIHKLIIICNPRSSHYVDVQREVLAPARRLKGWLVGKYELKPTDVDDNAKELAKLLDDGDLAVAVGGDGTAAVVVNGIMQSGKDVTFAALGYGNFNDVARMLGAKLPVEYGGEYIGELQILYSGLNRGRRRRFILWKQRRMGSCGVTLHVILLWVCLRNRQRF